MFNNGYPTIKVRAGDYHGAQYENTARAGENILGVNMKPANTKQIAVTHLYVGSHGVTIPIIKEYKDETNDDLKYFFKYAFRYLTGRVAVRNYDLDKSDIDEILYNANDLREVLQWCKNERVKLKKPFTRFDKTRATRCYRLAGDNTYYYKYANDVITSYNRKPVHFSVTRKLKKCSACNRSIYANYNERNYDGTPVIKLWDGAIGKYCFECSDKFKACPDCLQVNPAIKDGAPCVPCENDFKRNVHGYGYRPKHFHFYDVDKSGQITSTPKDETPDVLKFGIEWETEFLDGYDDYEDDREYIADVARNIKDELKQFRIYATSDSSLNSGMELHNHPTTFLSLIHI